MRADSEFIASLAAKIGEIRDECDCIETIAKLDELEEKLMEAAFAVKT